MADFNTDIYSKLLKDIRNNNIIIFTVNDWIISKPKNGVMLRHDIDRFPANALKIAEIESNLGIKSTFYFRISTFNPIVVKKIADLGHEIGYHYEILSLAGGDYQRAKKIFQDHLRQFRQISPVTTCSMHGRPLSKFDNRYFWNEFKLNEFNLLAEAFLTVDYSDFFYFTDTGRSWSNNSINLRDRVKSLESPDISSTNELASFIINHPDSKIAIATHPERWSYNSLTNLRSFSWDHSTNTIKKIIKSVRSK